MRKVVKWGVIILLCPLLIFVLMMVALYIPPLQNLVVKKATAYASEASEMDIQIEKVRLAFPLNLVVEGVKVISQQDTLLSVGRMQVEVQLLPLLGQRVDIDGIRLQQARVNTLDLIPTMTLCGSLDEFYLSSHGVELSPETAVLNEASLKNADLHICLKDTVVAEETDTASAPLYWKFDIRKIALQQVKVNVQLDDTTCVTASVGELGLHNGYIDLQSGAYRLNRFVLQGSSFAYDVGSQPALAGWDASHIRLDGVEMQLDSLHYFGRTMGALVSRLQAKERSGLQIASLEAKIHSDEKAFRVPRFLLQTTDSYIDFTADVDWNALEPGQEASLTARFLAGLGKQDLMTFLGEMPEAFVRKYPNAPMVLRSGVDGNIDALRITGIQAQLEGAFRASMQGEVNHLLDSLQRSASLTFQAGSEDLSFVTALVDSLDSGSFVIPSGISLTGEAGISGEQYSADLSLREGTGLLTLLASYAGNTESYEVDLRIDSLQVSDLLPKDSLYYMSAEASLRGTGTDIYSPRTQIEAKAVLDTLQYAGYNLSDVTLEAALQQGQMKMTLDSDNPLVRLSSRLEGVLNETEVGGTFVMDVHDVDWYAMQMVQAPFNTSLRFSLDAKSDWKQLMALKGAVTRMKLITEKQQYTPKDLFFDAMTSADSTYMKVNAGDLQLKMESVESLDSILSGLTAFSEALLKQAEEKRLDVNALKSTLPQLCLQLSSGTENPASNYLALNGIRFERFHADIDTSPLEGINGWSSLYALRMDSLRLDTLRFDIRQDTTGIQLLAGVKNIPGERQPFVFDATLDGQIHENGLQFELKYLDAEQRTGVHLGIGADLVEDGLRGYLFPQHPIIAYQSFNLNQGNYLHLRQDGHIEGAIDILDDEGMGVRFYSTPNEEAFQDLTLDLCQIDIGGLLRALPYMPDITGILNSEVHYVVSDNQMSLVAETSVDSLSYEKNLIGNVTNSLIYLPKDDVTHYVNTHFAKEGDDIFILRGDYKDVGDGLLDMGMTLDHFPLDLANGFIPDRIVALRGDLDGTLEVDGTLSTPNINGELMMDSVYVDSDMYGVSFRFDQKPVTIANSCMAFDRYNIYTAGENPFSIDGKVDFANLDRIALDLRMRAADYELVNAPYKKTSVVYGKVYVDFFAMLNGTLDDLRMRGTMNVRNKTDVAYVLKDSPLTVEDRLSDLVTFVNFNDTANVIMAEEMTARPLGGIDMLMTLQIDQGAEIRVDLSADRESYIELLGGGNLSMQYTPQGDLLLSGRYTLTSGEMKYELPVIPLKTFNIKSGSYVEFTGNPMNPTMNIAATERVRASVTENETPRTVSFDVGVSITNSLENMGLEFTLEAPEDMSVQNQLAAMSKEERGKLAVAMLATGIYMGGEDATGGFTANSALNSFLQNEISNIAGSALKTVDISVGMEDATSADGSSHTDYSFRFAKRFWNNRLSVVIGGSISSGNDAAENSNKESFIDDVSLEWRLDDSGTRYIRVFHNKNYESILEGEITETGVGIVLRRKMTKFGELFIFKKKKNRPANREVTPRP